MFGWAGGGGQKYNKFERLSVCVTDQLVYQSDPTWIILPGEQFRSVCSDPLANNCKLPALGLNYPLSEVNRR